MFFGALAGGVGLLLRPLLLLLGFPPISAISAPRIGATVGELPGLWVLHKQQSIDWKLALWITLPLAGAALAANYFITIIPAELLRKCMAVILILVAIAYIFYRDPPRTTQKRTWGTHLLANSAYAVTSFLGSFTGGVGPILTIITVKAYNKPLFNAVGTWRVASYISATLASVVFIIRGVVDWRLTAALALGLAVGSYAGTRYAIGKGESWTRIIIIILVLLSAGILLIT